jgi:hypothetical protein
MLFQAKHIPLFSRRLECAAANEVTIEAMSLILVKLFLIS